MARLQQLEQINSLSIGYRILRVVGIDIGEGDSRAWNGRTRRIGNLTCQASACALPEEQGSRADEAENGYEQQTS
jgi:hypothetical protein